MLRRSTQIISAVLSISFYTVAFAYPAPDPTNPSLIPPAGTISSCDFQSGRFGAECIIEYLQYIIALVFMFIGAFFLIMIIIAGYQYALGSIVGSKEAGRERLKWAITGFIVSALSFAIISFIVGALSGT